MSEEKKSDQESLFRKSVNVVKSGLTRLGGGEWALAEKFLGKNASAKLEESALAFSNGELKEGWTLGKEAKTALEAGEGPEGRLGSLLDGPPGRIMGGIIHRAMGSTDVDYAKIAKENPHITFQQMIQENVRVSSEALANDLQKAKSLIFGGAVAHSSPPQTTPSDGMQSTKKTRE